LAGGIKLSNRHHHTPFQSISLFPMHKSRHHETSSRDFPLAASHEGSTLRKGGSNGDLHGARKDHPLKRSSILAKVTPNSRPTTLFAAENSHHAFPHHSDLLPRCQLYGNVLPQDVHDGWPVLTIRPPPSSVQDGGPTSSALLPSSASSSYNAGIRSCLGGGMRQFARLHRSTPGHVHC